MNDLIPGARVEGTIAFDGRTSTRRTSTRSRSAVASGMVFQKPNPFPKSIYDNVAYGRARSPA